MVTNLKFSLSVQINKIDSNISYTVSAGARSWHQDGLEYHEWEYNPKKILIVAVNLTKVQDTQSHIIISNLIANNVDIGQFDKTGTYTRHDTGEVVKNAYGYMSWSGVYIFKIRYAPQIHNYITYITKLIY